MPTTLPRMWTPLLSTSARTEVDRIAPKADPPGDVGALEAARRPGLPPHAEAAPILPNCQRRWLKIQHGQPRDPSSLFTGLIQRSLPPGRQTAAAAFLELPDMDQHVATIEFTYGVWRKVLETADGRRYVVDAERVRVYGLWYTPPDDPQLGTRRDSIFFLRRLATFVALHCEAARTRDGLAPERGCRRRRRRASASPASR
jgi:hypothetical protein